MNIIDVLKAQLAGDDAKKLGGLIGIGDSDMAKLVGVGIPSLLSSLGGLASSRFGAEKLVRSIGNIDSSSYGDLGKMLGSGAMNSGGNLLEGLLGGSLVDSLATAIYKHTNIPFSMVKMGLGYLAPIVLGSVGASFQGAKPNADGISKLFSDQKNNISAAIPAGFQLDSIPGINAIKDYSPTSQNESMAGKSGGLGKMLVTFAILIALSIAAYFIRNKLIADANNVKPPPPRKSALNGPRTRRMSAVRDTEERVDTVPIQITTKTIVTENLVELAQKLESITDVASAREFVPSLIIAVQKMETLSTNFNAMPAEGRSVITSQIKVQMAKLTPAIERISSFPELEDSTKAMLEKLRATLTSMAE